jgi:hypothetical protein
MTSTDTSFEVWSIRKQGTPMERALAAASDPPVEALIVEWGPTASTYRVFACYDDEGLARAHCERLNNGLEV